MGHYWNAKIETKLARSVSDFATFQIEIDYLQVLFFPTQKNGNERRLFLIKINGLTGGADVPFKIKTQRNE